MTLAEMLIAQGEILPDYQTQEKDILEIITEEVHSAIEDFTFEDFDREADFEAPKHDADHVESIPYPEDLKDIVCMEDFNFLKSTLTFAGVTSILNSLRKEKGIPEVDYSTY